MEIILSLPNTLLIFFEEPLNLEHSYICLLVLVYILKQIPDIRNNNFFIVSLIVIKNINIKLFKKIVYEGVANIADLTDGKPPAD